MRIIILLLLFCSTSFAAKTKDVSEPSTIILPIGTVHEGDYFVCASNVEISGKVTGDVYACASQLSIDGEVAGDVLAAGGSMMISGIVHGNARLIGGQITLSGTVGRNATVIGGNLDLMGKVAGNVVSVVGNGSLSAAIDGEATMVASNLRISGDVAKSMHAYVGAMRITSRAKIGGQLEYSSNTEAYIDPGAKIQGQLIHHPSLLHDILHGNWMQGVLVGSKVAAVLMNFLYTLVIGWILIRLFPKNLEAALYALSSKPLKCAASGIILLVVLPIASIILLMTILGAPFALTLIALNIVGFYTAKVYTVIWASNAIFPKIGFKPTKMPIFCVGLICYFILTNIPFIGIFIAFIAMLFGLGAAVLAQQLKTKH
jgi:cytoskeletal protein CcmA (bactofilin family)